MSLEFGIFAGWLLATSVPLCYSVDLMMKRFYNRKIKFEEKAPEQAMQVPLAMEMPKIVVKKRNETPPSRIFLRYHRLPE